jgi:hypothetical protein
MTETKQQTLADLERLEKKATPGPWAYRPYKDDDWGFIRGPFRYIAAISRNGDKKAVDLDDHRVKGTDPYEANGRLIVALRNHALPLLREQGEEIERLRDRSESFERIIWAAFAEFLFDTNDPHDEAMCRECGETKKGTGPDGELTDDDFLRLKHEQDCVTGDWVHGFSQNDRRTRARRALGGE